MQYTKGARGVTFYRGDRVQITGEDNLAMVGRLYSSPIGTVKSVYTDGPNVLLDGDEYVTAWNWENLIPAPTDDPAVNRRLYGPNAEEYPKGRKR